MLTYSSPRSPWKISGSKMMCGHWMHSDCLKEYRKHHATCPVCSKSLYDADARARMAAHYDMLVATTPMPVEYRHWKNNILCNDCLEKTQVKFHFHHKCKHCTSYNTTVIGTERLAAPTAEVRVHVGLLQAVVHRADCRSCLCAPF